MPSSHAVNNFAIAIFFSIVFSTRKVMGWVFTIALIVALTRLYLGLHYPSDILAGMTFGIALGYCFAKGYIFLEGKYFRGDELLLP
jgi:undecaprenyl-diphosphatase